MLAPQTQSPARAPLASLGRGVVVTNGCGLPRHVGPQDSLESSLLRALQKPELVLLLGVHWLLDGLEYRRVRAGKRMEHRSPGLFRLRGQRD